MAKEIAHQAGCDEVWMHEDGFVTEGGSSNAFIIKDNKLISLAEKNAKLNNLDSVIEKLNSPDFINKSLNNVINF